jgi:hypothetical protein
MRATILPAAAAPAARRPARHTTRGIASRWAVTVALVLPAVGALGVLLGAPRAADAQTFPVQPAKWEFRIPVGGLVPTGGQRASLKDAHLTAAQLSYVVRPPFALTATVAWARSRDLASAGAPRLNVFAYDLGAEARAPEWFAGRAVTVPPLRRRRRRRAELQPPLVGPRRHARRRRLRHRRRELGAGRVGLRLEVRDYVTGFKPLVGRGSATTRNDLVLMAGLRLIRR